jgi:hypothetical protein
MVTQLQTVFNIMPIYGRMIDFANPGVLPKSLF